MQVYEKPKETLFLEYQTTKEGLSEDEAAKRLSSFGKNELGKKGKKHPFFLFLAQFKDFMTILLMVSAALSAVFAFLTKDKNELVDTFILVFIILLNNVVSFLQQYRADSAIERMKKLSQSTTKVLRGGKVVLLDSTLLVPGDIVFFEEGDKIAADCRVLEAKHFKVNESSLTGESEQVEKSECVLAGEKAPAEQKNMLFSATFVTKGNATALVVGTGAATQIGRIASLVEESVVPPTPMERTLDKIGKVISYFVVGIACLLFVFGAALKKTDLLSNFMSSIAIAVAAVPEGLPAVVTILMALGVQRLSAERAIVRRLQAIETLGGCNVLCSDKTGTLTENKMRVEEVALYGNEVESLRVMRLCHSLKSETSGDETELALLRYQKGKYSGEEGEKLDEIPFDSERKMMSVLCLLAGEKVIYCKGGVEILLKKSLFYAVNGQKYPLTEQKRGEILRTANEMAKKALRVIGFAKREYAGEFKEEGLTFLGFAGLLDPPKKSAFTSVKHLKRAGILPVMITGDTKETALAVAKSLAIASKESEVLTGEELSSLSGEERKKRMLSCRVFARVEPSHKGIIVETFQKEGFTVAMTGDGVNDAPALKKADIGVAMGSGTDVAKSVSDIVLEDDDLSTVVKAVGEGRRIFSNVKRTVGFYLATNLGEVLSILFLTLFLPQITFLTSTQLLFINLVTDSFPVLAFSAEKAEKDALSRPPERAEKAIFRPSFLLPVAFFGFIQAAATSAVFLVFLKEDLPLARTAAMLTMSFFELVYAFHQRTDRESILGKKFFENKVLLLTVFAAALLSVAICEVPFLAGVFDLTPLSGGQILLCFLLSLAILPMSELYKLLLRRRSSARRQFLSAKRVKKAA